MISVIVPVYNVERYIRQCVESILEQTYADLEIILVDDGSTDGSGSICDEYKLKDNRVVVIHKCNGGLSEARNAGLDIARGEYIGFVDSDDYIEPDMYEVLYKNCERYAADLAAARFVKFNTQGEVRKNFTENIEVFSREEMLRLFIVGDRRYEITMSVWDRLYKRELISDLRFPVGKCYEDIVFSTKVIEKSKTFSNPNYKSASLKTASILYEYMDPRVSKTHGLQEVMAMHKIEMTDLCTFGDADNDYDMTLNAGVGVVMANGSEKTKSVADFITDDNNHDGIANFINKYIL